jgi:hypothetical protein
MAKDDLKGHSLITDAKSRSTSGQLLSNETEKLSKKYLKSLSKQEF